MSKRMIVFAPHPDDETLGCGGTIVKRRREGYEVTIVTMTDGQHAFSTVLGIYSDPTPEELKHIRREETVRAATVLGVLRRDLIFLGFEDGHLSQDAKNVEDEVVSILKRELPNEIFFPYRKDYHTDHQAANRIIMNSVAKVHTLPVMYQYSIRQKYSRFGPFADRMINILKHNMITIDISEFLALKEAAVREFRSQVSIISDAQKRPIVAETENFLKNKEVFYLK